jgi:dTDP-glucose 4,6-dehydratase
MKNILVTGGAGFIGSNFIEMMLNKYNQYNIINVDALTYAGNRNNMKGFNRHINYFFYRTDIRNKTALQMIFESHHIDAIVHFAAETHVDRSIIIPKIFISTNVNGTQNLLDCALDYGVEKFLQISTDEVYGALGKFGKFTEESCLLPNSPYSASKASADCLVRAYHKTFDLPMNITRCSNNYGPHQHEEKLIPLVITKALKGESIPVYGDGLQIRDWIFVKDHCVAIDKVLHHGVNGEVYNIGSENEVTNIEIIKTILSLLEVSESLITYVKDRPGHDRRYAIDNTKIEGLGWYPVYTLTQGLTATIDWYCGRT